MKHYSNLADANMARQEGSLYHIKETFRFRGINLAEPSQTVHQWMEFVEFVTDGYILTLYMKTMNVMSLNKLPKTFPKDGSDEEKADFMLASCVKIMKVIHPDTKDNQHKTIAEASREAFCICKKNKGKHALLFLNK